VKFIGMHQSEHLCLLLYLRFPNKFSSDLDELGKNRKCAVRNKNHSPKILRDFYATRKTWSSAPNPAGDLTAQVS
jgi:hypothetical protein